METRTISGAELESTLDELDRMGQEGMDEAVETLNAITDQLTKNVEDFDPEEQPSFTLTKDQWATVEDAQLELEDWDAFWDDSKY